MDLVRNHLGLEALGVALEALHEVRALHAVRVGRPVVHVGRRHQLLPCASPAISTGLRFARAA